MGDVHRTLLYGGVFGYPSDKKNKNGKLRLLYEGAPMSYLMEQAGGLSSTGTKRVMEIEPEEVRAARKRRSKPPELSLRKRELVSHR